MTQITRPCLLWTLAPQAGAVLEPDTLLTGAPSDVVAVWLLRNRWARRKPRFRFANARDVRKAGRLGRFFVAAPFRDENDPQYAGVIGEAGADRPPPFVETATDGSGCDPRVVTAAIMAAAVIAAHTPLSPPWEVIADATDGMLAIGVASAQQLGGRHAVAQALATPSSLNVAMSARWGVNVLVVVDLAQTRAALDARPPAG